MVVSRIRTPAKEGLKKDEMRKKRNQSVDREGHGVFRRYCIGHSESQFFLTRTVLPLVRSGEALYFTLVGQIR